MVAQGLDIAEHVVPTATVQADDVIAQFPDDFVHLERCRQGFDQDGGLDRALRQPDAVLGEQEHLVPEPGFFQ